jgi:hypothetical protein
MPMNKDWREFIELLNSNGVECLVVGAFAVAFHGFPRYTPDLDLLVRPTRESISHWRPESYFSCVIGRLRNSLIVRMRELPNFLKRSKSLSSVTIKLEPARSGFQGTVEWRRRAGHQHYGARRQQRS